MKKYLFALLLLGSSGYAFSGPSVADGSRSENCAVSANIFLIAADTRDSGQSPESALQRIQPLVAGSENFPLKYQKFIVNTVFFNPAYLAPGRTLSERQYATCMNDRPTYQPLK